MATEPRMSRYWGNPGVAPKVSPARTAYPSMEARAKSRHVLAGGKVPGRHPAHGLLQFQVCRAHGAEAVVEGQDFFPGLEAEKF